MNCSWLIAIDGSAPSTSLRLPRHQGHQSAAHALDYRQGDAYGHDTGAAGKVVFKADIVIFIED